MFAGTGATTVPKLVVPPVFRALLRALPSLVAIRVGVRIMTIERAAARRNRARDNRTIVRASWSQGLLLLLAMAPLGILSGCSGVVGAQSTPPPPQAAFQLAPASLDFGSVAMGTKVSQTATVKNSGKTPIKIMQDSVTNNQFGVSGVTFPFTLAVGQSTNVSVWFNGTTPGKASGTLTVQGDSGTSPASVALSATALASQAQLSLSTSSVNFGSVTVGAKGSSVVTVSNTGASDLTISVITINGAPFGVSGIATPKTIIAGQSATFTATYSPTAAGNDTGSIVITSNDPNSPATIALTGAGSTAAVGRLTLTPASLNFGNTAVGSNSVLPTTLTNSGQATVSISQIAVSGAEFTMSGLSAPASLAPGQSVPLAVKFAPTATGNAAGSVTITSNAGNSPVQLTMAGSGGQAGLRVSPT
jgi:HYDIN/CFA65/VesB family protein